MSDDGLFREEALRRWRQGGIQGEVLRLAPGWTRWAFLAVVMAVAAATAAAFFVTVPVSVQGPAVLIEEDQVLGLFPAARRADLEREPFLLWSQRGGATFPLRLLSIEPQVRNKEEARSLAGGAFAGRPIPDASLVVWATPAAVEPFEGRGAPLEGPGMLSLPPRRERLLDLLLPRGR